MGKQTLLMVLCYCAAKLLYGEANVMRADRIFSPEQHKAFQEEGYVVVSGLLDADEVDRLVKAGQSLVQHVQKGPLKTFSVIEKNLIYELPPSVTSVDGASKDEEDCLDSLQILNVFRHTAIRSSLAQAAAELMQLDPETQNARVLRDVFLAKPVNETEKCDWHVDDKGFWPESYISSASDSSGKDQYGINVWVAMDDMPSKFEGSMAVARGSHRADWRHDGYKAIGQDRMRDEQTSREDLVRLFAVSNNTCNIDQTDPELRAKFEQARVVFDIKSGDAIFATRLLFHRTLSVTGEGKAFYSEIGKANLNRYSIRYVPGSARLPTSYNLELSLLSNNENRGRTLDEVCEKDGALWYPVVWPVVPSDIDERLDELASTRLPSAKKKSENELKELRAAFAASAEKGKSSS